VLVSGSGSAAMIASHGDSLLVLRNCADTSIRVKRQFNIV
jgi:hypothetical protein